MTVTYKLDVDWIKMNHIGEYVRTKAFRSKIIV